MTRPAIIYTVWLCKITVGYKFMNYEAKKDTKISFPPCRCKTKISSRRSLPVVKGPAESLSTNTVISTFLESSETSEEN